MATSSELEQRIQTLLEAALKLDPAERAAFIERATADTPSLRQEIELRLAARKAADHPTSPSVTDRDEGSTAQIGQLLGHYKVLAFLGRGGMGEVYLAQDARLGRKVALKLLPAHFTSNEKRVHRFQQEARAASALNHPNIITIHEIGQLDGRHFIAMEFIDGETLGATLRSTNFKLRATLEVAIQIASALVAAHKAGIIHRDLKTENIMVRRED